MHSNANNEENFTANAGQISSALTVASRSKAKRVATIAPPSLEQNFAGLTMERRKRLLQEMDSRSLTKRKRQDAIDRLVYDAHS